MNFPEEYIPNAQTPEEHASNVMFQLGNVLGWMNHTKHRDCAAIKAECLLDDAKKLVAAFEAEGAAKAAVADAPLQKEAA